MRHPYVVLLFGALGAATLGAACATGSNTDTGVEDDASGGSTAGPTSGPTGGSGGAPAGPTVGPGGMTNGPGAGAGPGVGGAGGALVGGAGGDGGAGGTTVGPGGTGGSVGIGGGGGAGGTPIVCTPILLDSSFEAGTPNPSWAESSTNFGTPLCTTASCGGGSPLTGTWFYWGGGYLAPVFGFGTEISIVSQTLVIPVGTATLEWRMAMPNCDVGFTVEDYFGIRIDGTTVVYLTDTLSDPSCGSSVYQLRSVNLSAFADGGTHSIEIITDQYFDDFISTDVTNVFVDDVVLTSCQ